MREGGDKTEDVRFDSCRRVRGERSCLNLRSKQVDEPSNFISFFKKVIQRDDVQQISYFNLKREE